MNSPSKGSVIFVRLFSIIILLLGVANLHAQTGAPCGCEDVPDLINQLNIANATLSKLDEIEQKLSKIVAPTIETNGGALSKELAQLIAAIENTKARVATGDIDTVSCKAKIDAGTPCLSSILQLRESVNERYCIFAKSREKFSRNDRRSSWPMHTYIEEQRQAYTAEIMEILRILSKLPPDCRPKGWFGTITVIQRIKQRTIVEKESTEDTSVRTGTIAFNGDGLGLTRSFWQVEGSYINEKTGGGKSACTGGLRPTVADTPYTTSSKIELNRAGATAATTVVNIGEPDEDEKVQVSFGMSKVITKVTGQSQSRRDSGCPKDSFNVSGPLSRDDSTFDAGPVDVTSRITHRTKTDPGKIVGSEIIQVMSLTTPQMEMSHTITVSFQLYKL